MSTLCKLFFWLYFICKNFPFMIWTQIELKHYPNFFVFNNKLSDRKWSMLIIYCYQPKGLTYFLLRRSNFYYHHIICDMGTNGSCLPSSVSGSFWGITSTSYCPGSSFLFVIQQGSSNSMNPFSLASSLCKRWKFFCPLRP